MAARDDMSLTGKVAIVTGGSSGIGRALLAEAEMTARAAGKTLLVLDTREGDPSNDLYRAAGWTEAGRVPKWAQAADGRLAGTVFYFKDVSPGT